MVWLEVAFTKTMAGRGVLGRINTQPGPISRSWGMPHWEGKLVPGKVIVSKVITDPSAKRKRRGRGGGRRKRRRKKEGKKKEEGRKKERRKEKKGKRRK